MRTFWELLSTELVRHLIRTVALVGLALFVFYGLKVAWHRKIQPPPPRKRQTDLELKMFVLNLALFPIFTVMMSVTMRANGIATIRGTPLLSAIPDMLLMFVAHDAYFYWTHRAMHHRSVYRFVHLVHHRSYNPTPLAAYTFHPFESLINTSFAIVYLPLKFMLVGPVPFASVMMFMVLYTMHNVYIHLGIEIFPRRLVDSPIGRWFLTSTHHNLHHAGGKGHYGLYTLFWDRLCGTMIDGYFDKLREVTSRTRQQAPAPVSAGHQA
jgi:lathosterol oxidase